MSLDSAYEFIKDGLEAVEEARIASAGAPTLGFWATSGSQSLPAPLDDVIEEEMSREDLLGEMTDTSEPPSLGKWSSLKIQASYISMFERDCRARHSTRAMSYGAAAIEGEKRIASAEFLREELEAVGSK